MATLFEGTCIGKPVNVEFGADNNNRPCVRWEMEVTQGEHKGKRARYKGKFDEKSIKWTKRDMRSIGWKTDSVKTFLADVAAANVEIEFVAEIAEYDGNRWTSAKMTGAPPLTKLDDSKIAEVDQWFAAAEDIAPPSSNDADFGGYGGKTAANSGDDIPF